MILERLCLEFIVYLSSFIRPDELEMKRRIVIAMNNSFAVDKINGLQCIKCGCQSIWKDDS